MELATSRWSCSILLRFSWWHRLSNTRTWNIWSNLLQSQAKSCWTEIWIVFIC